MGYYTCFTLETKTSDNLGEHPDRASIIERLRSENESAEYALDENGETHSDAKWYEHENDLREFSKLYPDVLFELYGDGENSDDFWYEYFKDGKMQYAPVRFEYSSSTLRESVVKYFLATR